MSQESTQEVLLHTILSGPKNQTGPSTTTASSASMPDVCICHEQAKPAKHAPRHSPSMQKHCLYSHPGTPMPGVSKALQKHQNSAIALLSHVHISGPGETHSESPHPRTTTPGIHFGSIPNHSPPVFHAHTPPLVCIPFSNLQSGPTPPHLNHIKKIWTQCQHRSSTSRMDTPTRSAMHTSIQRLGTCSICSPRTGCQAPKPQQLTKGAPQAHNAV